MLHQEDVDRIKAVVLEYKSMLMDVSKSDYGPIVAAVSSGSPYVLSEIRDKLSKVSPAHKTDYLYMHHLLTEVVPSLDEDVVRERIALRGFKGYADSPLAPTKTALAEAENLARHCCRFLTYVQLRKPKSGKISQLREGFRQESDEEKYAVGVYKKWFDQALDSARMDKVAANFTKIERALTTAKLEIVCDSPKPGTTRDDTFPYPGPRGACMAGWWGAAIPGESLTRFYVCELSYGAAKSTYDLDPYNTKFGAKSLKVGQSMNIAVTIIHELSHLKHIAGTDDVDGEDGYSPTNIQTWAKSAPAKSVRNADTYAYFAFDVHAYLTYLNKAKGS